MPRPDWKLAQDWPIDLATQAQCCINIPEKALDARHKLLRIPQIIHSSTTRTYLVNPQSLAYSINVHASCICNELRALTNRHLVDRTYIPFDQKLWTRITRKTTQYYPTELHPVRYTDVINAYSGAKKAMYVRALENLKATGFLRKHAVVKMFVKPDRYPSEDIKTKDPRAIQSRTPQYNLELSRYIKAFEHHIYKSVTMGVVSETRVIAKGLNPIQRAELILEKARHFDDPIFILLDHSRFDSTINTSHLRSTHVKYQRAFKSGHLRTLLRCQLNNICYSKNGIKYQTKATRMSGDPDTGCGNSVINADVLWGFFKFSNILKYDFVLDGDDSIGFIERSDFDKLDMGLFGRMGFDTKFSFTDNIHQAEFCQSRLVLTTPPRMVRNPVRAISHSQSSRRKYPLHQYKQWVSAVGACELSINQGVPIMQAFGYQLSQISKVKLFDEDTSWRMIHGADKIQPITTQARISFYEAWGVAPGLQEALEQLDYTANAVSLLKYKIFKRNPVNKIEKEYVRAFISVSGSKSIYESLPKSSGSSWWCCS